MGIPGFYGRWLRQNISRAIYHRAPNEVSSCAFDLNGLIHQAKTEVLEHYQKHNKIKAKLDNVIQEIFQKVWSLILQIIKLVKPYDYLILAVDGMAPLAKLQQQKSRREKSAAKMQPGEFFDGNMITPGTKFMLALDEFLREQLEKYQDKLPPQVIYSSHLVPGEGEHKIMNYYRQGIVMRGLVAQRGGKHVIVGLDADFIVLSLLSPLNNIFLYRYDAKDKSHNFVDMDQVKKYLLKYQSRQRLYVWHDFTVIMSFMGNDFLPFTPALQDMRYSLDYFLNIYEASGSLTIFENNRYEINWSEMFRFLERLAQSEPDLLYELSGQSNESKMETRHIPEYLIQNIEQGRLNMSKFRYHWYQRAFGFNKDEKLQLQLQNITGVRQNLPVISKDKITMMVNDYLRTFSWIYLYYTEGQEGINLGWHYRYHFAPLLIDIFQFLKDQSLQSIQGYQAYDGMVKYTVLHQLLAVLPLRSKELLPEELQQFMEDDSPIRDFYPTSFQLDSQGTRNEHESIAMIPFINMPRIIDCLTLFRWPLERILLWLPQQDLILTRELTEKEEELILQDLDSRQEQAELQKQELTYYVDLLFKIVKQNYRLNPYHIENVNKQLTTMMRQKQHGRKLWQQVKNMLIKLKPFPEKDGTHRVQERVKQVESFLAGFRPRRYLDIGGGNGDITKGIAAHFQLTANNVFLLDPKGKKSANYQLLTYPPGGQNIIPLPDQSIEFITLFVVLHHMNKSNRLQLLREIARVLTPGGYLILREHDGILDPLFQQYVDTLHMIYYVKEGEDLEMLDLFSKSELKELLQTSGLKFQEERSYDKNNPQRLYYALVRKGRGSSSR